jgi:hypothetical protein
MQEASQLIVKDKGMLRHSYSWDCRCEDCLGFEVRLRKEIQAEENQLKAKRYGANQICRACEARSSTPEVIGQVTQQKELNPTVRIRWCWIIHWQRYNDNITMVGGPPNRSSEEGSGVGQ